MTKYLVINTQLRTIELDESDGLIGSEKEAIEIAKQAGDEWWTIEESDWSAQVLPETGEQWIK
jgi:hypothetical protein